MSIVPAFAVEGLGHRFGQRRALKDVSFSIEPGDFTVLLGLNGAGKTTLFSLATRLYAQSEGTIRIFDKDIREWASECLRQMGIVFQQPTLDLDLTVDQNLLYHSALHGLSHRDAAQRIAVDELVLIDGGDGPTVVSGDRNAAAVGLVPINTRRGERRQRSSPEK